MLPRRAFEMDVVCKDTSRSLLGFVQSKSSECELRARIRNYFFWPDYAFALSFGEVRAVIVVLVISGNLNLVLI